MNMDYQRKLGDTDIVVPDIGIGTNTWGNAPFEDVYQAYQAFLDAGINFFDTAPVYGKSEQMLGECRKKDGRPIIISTKFTPSFSPWGKKSGPVNMFKSLDASLLRMGVEKIDLFILHFPPSLDLLDKYVDSLTQAVKSGKVLAVGVSNFNESLLRLMHEKLKNNGIPLAVVQCGYSLIMRTPEYDGVLKACKELNISFMCHSPLYQGVLSGKYRSKDTKMPVSKKMMLQIYSIASSFQNRKAKVAFKQHSIKREKLEPLFVVMEEIGRTRGKSISQVAVNWLLSTDSYIIPIPGARNLNQATSNIGIANWRLTEEEYKRISEAEIASR